jgi:hypothetical protein
MGGIGGYRDPATGKPAILRATYLGYLKGFGLRIWSALYFPVNWSHKPEPWMLLSLLACIVTLSWIAVRARCPRAKVSLGLGFIIIALLPIAHLLLVDVSLLGAGRFYLALPGFAILLGVAIQSATKAERLLLALVLVGFQLAALRHNITIWEGTATLAAKTCSGKLLGLKSGGVLVSGLPSEIDGIPFLGVNNGFEACVTFHQPGAESRVTGQRELRWDDKTREIVTK